MVRSTYAKAYDIQVETLSEELAGYCLSLRFTPLAPEVNDEFRVTNVYLYTGVNHFLVKEKQLALISRLNPMKYDFLMGDLNFIEHEADSASGSPYYALPDRFAKAWESFCGKYRLRGLPSDRHTFFRVGADANYSSRLDRIYHSYDDAELVLFAPFVDHLVIPNSILKDARVAVGREDIARRRHFDSDHIPVALRFSDAPPIRHGHQIPNWVTKTRTFSKYFEELWSYRPRFSDVFSEAEDFKELPY